MVLAGKRFSKQQKNPKWKCEINLFSGPYNVHCYWIWKHDLSVLAPVRSLGVSLCRPYCSVSLVSIIRRAMTTITSSFIPNVWVIPYLYTYSTFLSITKQVTLLTRSFLPPIYSQNLFPQSTTNSLTQSIPPHQFTHPLKLLTRHTLRISLLPAVHQPLHLPHNPISHLGR